MEAVLERYMYITPPLIAEFSAKKEFITVRLDLSPTTADPKSAWLLRKSERVMSAEEFTRWTHAQNGSVSAVKLAELFWKVDLDKVRDPIST